MEDGIMQCMSHYNEETGIIVFCIRKHQAWLKHCFPFFGKHNVNVLYGYLYLNVYYKMTNSWRVNTIVDFLVGHNHMVHMDIGAIQTMYTNYVWCCSNISYKEVINELYFILFSSLKQHCIIFLPLKYIFKSSSGVQFTYIRLNGSFPTDGVSCWCWTVYI